MIIIKRPPKPTIKQSQLDDVFGTPTIARFNIKNKQEAKAARKNFKKWFHEKKRKRKIRHAQDSTGGRQASLLEFLPKKELPPLPKPAYAWRFRSIPNVQYEDFAINVISFNEWCELHDSPTFTKSTSIFTS